MPSKAQKYFDKRALEDAVRSINLSEDFIEQKLKKYYKKASKEIQEYIEQFYEKFANQEDITLAEAKRMIKKADFKNIDFEALAKYAIVAEDEQLSTYVNALSKKGQITRLELLNLEINKTLSKLFDEEQVSVYELLADTYEDSYYRNIYNVQSYFQIGVDFIKPNEDVIRNAVTQSWSKSNYSERIWGHKKQLAENLREHITTGLIQGNSVNKMASKMSKDMDVSLSNAKRLVRTEINYVHNKATLDSYREYADIEQYKYLATLDNRTSKQCQELDCKIFDTKDAEVGTNYPPMHPNCRSTTVVYFKEDPIGSRIARGADGKTYYVPVDMSYKEWLDSLSEADKDKMKVDLKQRHRHNQDKEQLQKYKKVLGKNAPSTIAKFQEMKYNNTKEWEELKAQYKKSQPSIEKGFKDYSNPKSIPDEYKTYINTLSEVEKDILRKYTGFTATEVNYALRRNKISEKTSQKIELLDKAIAKGVLPENVILKRGTVIQNLIGFENIKNLEDVDISALKRTVFEDKAFCSTSLIAPEEKGRNTIITIFAPKGFKGAIYLEPLAYDKYKYQQEILLKRNCKFKTKDAIIKENILYLEVILLND